MSILNCISCNVLCPLLTWSDERSVLHELPLWRFLRIFRRFYGFRNRKLPDDCFDVGCHRPRNLGSSPRLQIKIWQPWISTPFFIIRFLVFISENISILEIFCFVFKKHNLIQFFWSLEFTHIFQEIYINETKNNYAKIPTVPKLWLISLINTRLAITIFLDTIFGLFWNNFGVFQDPRRAKPLKEATTTSIWQHFKS